MANTILIKRSGSDGTIPASANLSLGELAINTFNGRLFAKKDNGSVTVVDLTRNDPIRVLGDATSTYEWDQTTYTSNVTIALINSGVTSGTYGAKTANTIQNGGNIQIPTFQVHANGIVHSASTVTISASDFGTMAVQDSNNVNITGGNITGVSVSISGGDGTFGNVTVNGKLFSNDITAAAITADGDVTITGNLTVQGTQTIVDSTTVAVGDKNIVLAKDATNAAQADGAGLTVVGPGTSATIVYDGVGDKWELNKAVTLLNDLEIRGGDLTTNQTTFNLLDATATTINFGGAATAIDIGASTGNTAIKNNAQVDGTLTVTGLTTLNGGLSADGGKFTIADTTGDIHTDGNLDVDGSVTINTDLTIDGVLYANGGVNFDTGAFTVANATGDIHTNGNLDVDQNTTLNGTLTVDGLATLDGGITADSGAFTVANGTGDIHTSGNLDVDQNTTLNGTLTVDSLASLNGGIAVDTNKFTVADGTGDTYIDGTLDVKGDLTTDDVAANGIVFGDNVSGALTTDVGFTYNSTSNTLTAENITSTGNISVGNLTINGTTSLGSITSSGVSATQVVYGGAGGAFKGEAAFTYAEATDTLSVGNITVADDVAVNGGDLTTTAGTFNLVNANATTVNFAGAATTVAIGAAGSAGTLTVKNDNVVLDGDLQVKGGDLTTNQTTFNLVNDTATTVNFAGAATTVEIGASSGTTTINNNGQVDGTLNVTGNVSVNTNKFNVTASSGDTAIAGTLGIQGATTVNNTLDVTGAATFANVVALITANAQMTLSNYSTGSLRVLGDASINGKLQVSGPIYKGGFEVINTQDVIDGGTY